MIVCAFTIYGWCPHIAIYIGYPHIHWESLWKSKMLACRLEAHERPCYIWPGHFSHLKSTAWLDHFLPLSQECKSCGELWTKINVPPPVCVYVSVCDLSQVFEPLIKSQIIVSKYLCLFLFLANRLDSILDTARIQYFCNHWTLVKCINHISLLEYKQSNKGDLILQRYPA